MSSMSRTIRRGIAKRNGTFTPQKPLRIKPDTSKKGFLQRMGEFFKARRAKDPAAV